MWCRRRPFFGVIYTNKRVVFSTRCSTPVSLHCMLESGPLSLAAMRSVLPTRSSGSGRLLGRWVQIEISIPCRHHLFLLSQLTFLVEYGFLGKYLRFEFAWFTVFCGRQAVIWYAEGSCNTIVLLEAVIRYPEAFRSLIILLETTKLLQYTRSTLPSPPRSFTTSAYFPAAWAVRGRSQHTCSRP